MQFLALPVGVVASVALGFLWLFLTPRVDLSGESPEMLFIAFVAIIPIHELIHAAVHPGMGLSDLSILGFWPSRLLFYAHYVGQLSRNRFIAILLMPLLIISAVPLLVCAVFRISSPMLAFASTLNALFALGICLPQDCCCSRFPGMGQFAIKAGGHFGSELYDI